MIRTNMGRSPEQDVVEHQDLADAGYWDQHWAHRRPPFHRLNYYDQRMHRMFAPWCRPGMRAVEVGCGGSRWIRYFEQTWNAEIWGIDYSKQGLAQTRSMALHPATRERLLFGDFFADHGLPQDHFDLVFSLGFIEHFTDTGSVIQRLQRLVRPGGVVLTMIPNFKGLYGWAQQRVGKDIYDTHVIFGPEDLDRMHTSAGLETVVPANYFGCFAPLVVSFSGVRRTVPLLASVVSTGTKFGQQAACWGLSLVGLDRESRAFSPNIYGVYRRRS